MSDITTLPPLPPSPSSSSSRRLSSSRDNHPPSGPKPLSSIRNMPSSVRIFQEQHLNEFAHLHLDVEQLSKEERERMLLVEKQKLEEARRIGRMKRQTMAYHSNNDKENADMDTRIGWRPLSLLARRQPLTKPSTLFVQHDSESQVSHQSQRRFSVRTEIITPTEVDTPDLSSPIPSDVNSPDLALITPNQLGLALGCPSPPLPPLPAKSKARPQLNDVSSVDSHGNNSTYSWASSFSGETVELRTAAHYVPSISEESAGVEQEREEVLDSPEKVKRRRKRIVAIAHTVRQLEGVGSREVEDPNFYHQLVKAWNERPGVQQPREPIWSPPNKHAPAPPIPPRPVENTFDPYLAPPTWLAPPPLNPYNASPVPSSDLEHRTPDLNEDISQSEEGHSNESYASSNPFRYSYASSLHDLALEQGLQHGTKLMSEKAWLRSPLFDQGTWFDANTPSAPLPVGTFAMAPRVPSPGLEESPSKSSENGPEAGCIPSTSQPQRTLRKHNTNIGEMKEKHRLGTPIDLGGSSASSSAPTNWGLGFLGNWLRDELADEAGPSVDNKEDFQYGEEGMISNSNTTRSNTRNKISSFLAQGDVVSVSATVQTSSRIALSEGEKEKKLENNQDMNMSMESIPLTINSTNIEVNLVIPPPLPTPEVEEIASQTGKPRSEIQPPLPKECSIVAKEYQYLNPSLRQSYSTPSDILYPHPHPHAPHDLPSTLYESSQHTHRSRARNQSQDGVGDLEVEVETEVRPSDRPVLPPQEEEGDSWDSSEISLSQSHFRTPPLKIHRRLRSSTHQDNLDPLISPRRTRSVSTPQLQELPPLPLSPISLTGVSTSTPPRTPKSHLRPVLPPLPPTPKYRRPTPPLLTNMDMLMRDRKNIIEGLDKVGAGCLPPARDQDQRQLQDYDHSCYLGSTAGGIVSQSDCDSNGMLVEHPAYPPITDRSQDDIGQPTAEVATPSPEIATTRLGDVEKALPSQSSSRPSRTPLILFILGFIMPILWFVGGWPILKPSPTTDTTEVQENEKRGIFRWVYHPDPMVRKCRYAAIISTPLILVAGVVAVVVIVAVL
ncbi:hypothetical protein I302_103103 [Kwoniella bestiolae CBS 10118]|uniref:Uncharacterized protein n=1 Tax=Kwoniella bestiolae CBS 10118 TaxID=1296100 RepID=A0A1B9GH01_9TREE|nr:hypothetical protein I302_01804 [Kwoniella bestiolae CBS 10118]OCF30285.1 hypothetical protein I302_01804 [Kwoniella bestiolae CBS 10118]